MRPIFVLLWKHAMVRKRRYGSTILELSFSILILLLSYLSKDTEAEMAALRAREMERYNSEHAHTPHRILYSPENNLTNRVMDDVGASFHTPRLDHVPENEEAGMFPVSGARIEEYMLDMQNIDAIVLFQIVDDAWPARLNYSIRMGKDFGSSVPSPLVPRYPFASDADRDPLRDSLEYTNATKEARNTEPQVLNLQWAIDIAYQRLRTSGDIEALDLEVFPAAVIDPGKITIAFQVASSCWMALVIIYVFLMSDLMIDKNTGIQELIKMEGVSIKTIFLAHFLNVLPGGLVYAIGGPIILKMSDNDNPIFPHTNSFLLFLSLMLHFLSVIPGAFVGAYLINTRVLISVICFMFYLTPSIIFDIIKEQIEKRASRVTTVLSTAMFPHHPLNWIMAEIGQHEAFGRGATFKNMGTAFAGNNGSVLEGLLAMMVQMVLYTLLAWYLALVRPGKYGQAAPCYFLCQRSYWSKKPEVQTVTVNEVIYEPNKEYFEEAPKGATPGIQIINVTKVFRTNVALSNLTLNVYKGELTVLLGHNGAGKTTLMNIITGLTSATAGKVLVNGMDTSLWRKEVRSQLGLCPQHNLYFADLTVKEHTILFGLLKGGKYQQVKEDSERLLKMLNVLDKANNMASQLSGGMKRRLQLACALSGGADVLILDEPTSGLDVETRRELWDLLLKLRGARTVLLTTHFMEEADALADRIAAMHAGTLRCHATPMFLKRAVGSGYRLTFTTEGPPDEAAISAVIRSAIPEAVLRDHALKSISYNLPAKNSSQFPALFSNLEANRSKLGICTIGVGKSTLDEVFMKLCSDITSSFETEQTANAFVPAPLFPKRTGPALRLRQFLHLLGRQFAFIRGKLKTFLFFEAFVPILMAFLLADLCNNKGLGNFNWDDEDSRNVTAQATRAEPADVDAALRLGIPTIPNPDRRLPDGRSRRQSNKTKKGHLSSAYARAPPRLLFNALAARSNYTPLQFPAPKDVIYPKMPLFVGMWYILYSIVFISVVSGYVQLPCTERATGTRHIHLMAGCPLVVYWAATFVAHVFLGTIFLILPNIIAQLAYDDDSTLNQAGFLVSSSVIFLLGMMAFCAQMYLVSVLFPDRVAHSVLIFLNMLFCLVTPIIHNLYQLLELREDVLYSTVLFVSYVMPHHAMVMALSESGVVARQNAACKLNRHRCPRIQILSNVTLKFNTEACCASADGNYASYWEYGDETPSRGLIVLACQFAIYSVILLLVDYGLLKLLVDRCVNFRLKPLKPRFGDPVIAAEKAYVEETVKKPIDQIPDTILCYGLHKKFNACCRKSHHAVKGINFSVKRGECFGLLGVNGAGKSTTFKMLNSEVCPTRGSLFSNGYFNGLCHKTKYMHTLSYCPQFFGLDDFLTGRQNLELLLTLRGLRSTDVTTEAASWIEEVGLTPYANKRVSAYSGGMARRLAAAAALCQQAGVALLDEPTAGVDIAARRRLHTAILRAKHAKAVIIASHSMDEIEALCDRMIIMAAGEICAMGSAAELRAQHAAGYAVTFKLFPEFSIYATMGEPEGITSEEDKVKEASKASKRKKETDIADEVPTTSKDPAKEAMKNQFMQEVQRKFSQSELQEDHGTMMRYHIKNEMPYSELFTIIEGLKDQFPQIIEDYTLTETTLEEVFLFFAKEALARKKL